MAETKKQTTPNPTRSDRLESSVKEDTNNDTEGSCLGNAFEKYDPVHEWYRPEIELAVKNSAKRKIDDEFNADTLMPTVPSDLEDALDKKALEGLHLASFREEQRRPYMSKRARDFMRHMGNWGGFPEQDGKVLHISFTASEVDIALKALSEEFSQDPLSPTLGDLSGVSAKTWFGILNSKLKGPEAETFVKFLEKNVIPKIIIEGRTAKELLLFFQDCVHLEPDETYVNLGTRSTREAAKRVSSSPPLRMLRQEMGYGIRAGRNIDSLFKRAKAACMEYLKPQAFLTGGSSDIIDICWSPDGSRFAMGSTTLNDIYNRPGNLMLGTIEQMEVKLLDGHKTPRPIEQRNPTLDNQMRSTVTGVAFSNDGCLLYSSGYDATIKIWSTEDGFLLDSVDLNGKVVKMSLSKPHNVIAGSTQNGWLELFSTDRDGETHIVKFQQNEQLYASTLIWADRINPNWLLAAYDTTTEDRPGRGLCAVYDASTKKKLSTIRPSAGRHFDMFLHQESGILVTGVSGSVTSIIRMYDVTLSSQTGRGPQFDISGMVNCPQKDINVVTMSPCARFITSSGTDGSTIVWDWRNLSEPLTQLWHGDTLMPVTPDTNLEAEDTGTTFAQWCPHDGYLYTGGSDGIVKVWDVKRANSLVRNLPALDAQIMSGEFSPGFDKLFIGSASGKATLFSMAARDGEALTEFSADMSGIIPDIDPDDGSVSQYDNDNDQNMDWHNSDVEDYYRDQDMDRDRDMDVDGSSDYQFDGNSYFNEMGEY
ncbi:WD40 repeat-like protein [Tuber magnatum]|uniref:WD40 repeat-like protein n=1 Tax=Tuber magnatum TaxID=42249 RepID=A0A317SHM1_9PEZI|nr:WD40 repeat-like protein [Tuber magnatum]